MDDERQKVDRLFFSVDAREVFVSLSVGIPSASGVKQNRRLQSVVSFELSAKSMEDASASAAGIPADLEIFIETLCVCLRQEVAVRTSLTANGDDAIFF